MQIAPSPTYRDMEDKTMNLYKFFFGDFKTPIFVNVYGVGVPAGLYERLPEKFRAHLEKRTLRSRRRS
jgi:hypothetical protein